MSKNRNASIEFKEPTAPDSEGSVIIRAIKRDARIKPVIISVFAFSVLAHLFRYTNSAFNSDSLGIFRGGIDIPKQIGRGRWLQPLYLYVRGPISAPFLIGLLATVYLALSAILIVKILGIRNRGRIVILCGLLAVAPAITITNAAFLPWTDIFMLSLLFSMISAWFMTLSNVKCRYLIAAVFLVLSLALYQAYIGACMVICLFWLLRGCLTGERCRDVIKTAAVMALTFAVGFLLYYGTFKICGLISAASSHSYNSVASATILTGDYHLLHLIKGAYKSVLHYILEPQTLYSAVAGGINVILILIAAVFFFLAVKTKDVGRIVISLFLVSLCPLAAFFIYLLYGNVSDLLTFPVSMLYFGVGVLFELVPQGADRSFVKGLSKAVFILSSILIFFNAVYANQLYVKKSVEEQETLSLMTRVLYQMEQTEGYVPGETKIALIGSLENSDAVIEKPGYASGGTIDYEISIVYYKNYRMYLTNIMGYPINLAEQEEAERIGQEQSIREMPAFPYPGYTKMYGDTLVVKLSDDR